MRARHRWLVLLASGLVVSCLPETVQPRVADAAQAADRGVLLVTDFSGKEHKLESWMFVTGTKHLSWLAPVPKPETNKKDPTTAKSRPPQGPEGLEFSEGKSAPLKKRVLTFVLLEHLRSIEFDHKKELMIVRLAKSDKEADDEVLYGLTGYIGMNVLTIEAQVDLGELGQATVKFQGGVSRGVTRIRFPAPKAMPASLTERPAVVTAGDRAKSVHAVVDLQPLYVAQDGSPQRLPTLFFQKTVKVDMNKIAKLSQVGGSSGSGGLVYDVTLKDGNQNPLTLIERTESAGRPLFLEGLVGRIAAGCKLFPMSVISEVQFDDKKKSD